MKIIKSLLILSIIFLVSCATQESEKNDASLIVCQFNMRYGAPNDGLVKERKKLPNGKSKVVYDGSHTWEKRMPLIKNFLYYQEVDLCGTQELSWFQVDDFKNMKGYKFVGDPTAPSKYEKKIPSANNIILYKESRLEVLEKGSFWLSETPNKESNGFGADKPRNCNWALFRDKLTNKKFYYFNTHFHHKGDKTRIESAKLTLKKIREIASDTPFMLGGDLNAKEDSEALKPFFKSDIIRDARKICKTPLYGVDFTNNYGYTGRKVLRYPTTSGETHTQGVIDWLFVSKNIVVEKYAVLSECLDAIWLSDHFPVVVKIELD